MAECNCFPEKGNLSNLQNCKDICIPINDKFFEENTMNLGGASGGGGGGGGGGGAFASQAINQAGEGLMELGGFAVLAIALGINVIKNIKR